MAGNFEGGNNQPQKAPKEGVKVNRGTFDTQYSLGSFADKAAEWLKGKEVQAVLEVDDKGFPKLDLKEKFADLHVSNYLVNKGLDGELFYALDYRSGGENVRQFIKFDVSALDKNADKQLKQGSYNITGRFAERLLSTDTWADLFKKEDVLATIKVAEDASVKQISVAPFIRAKKAADMTCDIVNNKTNYDEGVITILLTATDSHTGDKLRREIVFNVPKLKNAGYPEGRFDAIGR